jgi:hypothetical protein
MCKRITGRGHRSDVEEHLGLERLSEKRKGHLPKGGCLFLCTAYRIPHMLLYGDVCDRRLCIALYGYPHRGLTALRHYVYVLITIKECY